MGQRREWERLNRKNLASRQGSEPSEFLDLTQQIAKAKGMSKLHGPWMRACTRCGGYYDEKFPENHTCRPLPKTKKIKCRECGDLVDASLIDSHMRKAHPPTWWPNLPPKGLKARCKYCGRIIALRGMTQHNKEYHYPYRHKPLSVKQMEQVAKGQVLIATLLAGNPLIIHSPSFVATAFANDSAWTWSFRKNCWLVMFSPSVFLRISSDSSLLNQQVPFYRGV
jgi:hypothetical protein